MMTMMNIFVAYTSKRRSGTTWNKYGPTILTFISSILIMLEPSRHLFMDHSLLPAWFVAYKDDCNAEFFYCLSVAGWLFTILATYSGFILLMIGSLWNANIVSKLKLFKKKWNQIIDDHKKAKLLPDDDQLGNANKSESIVSPV